MSEIEQLFKELSDIQQDNIAIMLGKAEKYPNLEEILIDMSYEIIYRMIELMDGYKNDQIKYEMFNIRSNRYVNKKQDLHDLCEDFLKCTDI